MASSLTWLDYSERDRRRALTVIGIFRETGTMDELGLAAVRDSFADLFFPGTSTIQTRACYFLLVPWAFQRLERNRVASETAAQKARQAELDLNRRLRTGGDTRGVFGAQAGDSLKRLPSEVYWGGLGSWGIRAFPGHQWAYFRSLDGFYRGATRFRSTPRDPEGKTAPPTNWHPHLPEPPSGFPYENVSVALRREDAEYLRDRVQARHPESLLGVLAGRAERADLEPDWPWKLSQLPGVSCVLRHRLDDARLFSICMHGAALLYNLMLAELRKHEKWIGTYQRELNEWATDVETLKSRLVDWELEGVWSVVRAQGRSVSYPMQCFAQHWVEHLSRNGPEAVVQRDSPARRLVREREIQLKRSRARLPNPRRLELWGGRSGTDRLTYRWGAARRILGDIFDGLTRSEDDARDA